MRKQAQHAEQFNKKIVNGYQFLSVLGKGSFGEVYKASKQNSIYAIKLIEKELVKRKKLEQYVDNEIKIMKELNSQYIVKLHDTFQDKEFLYIVMEFCNEGTLFQYVIEKKPSNQDCYKIFAQILRGFRSIHEKQFLHRDLKPDNIFIKDGIFKIADFGLSKPSSMGSTYCGTSYFMAPEILKYKPHNYKADLWSLGVIFYFMVFRDFPFKNKLSLLAEIEEKSHPYFDINKQLSKKWQKEKASEELRELFKNIFIMNPNKRITFEQLYGQKVFELIIEEEERRETQTLYKKIETLGTVKNTMFTNKSEHGTSEEEDEDDDDEDYLEAEEQQQKELDLSNEERYQNQRKSDPFDDGLDIINSEVHLLVENVEIIKTQLYKPSFPRQGSYNNNSYSTNNNNRKINYPSHQKKSSNLKSNEKNKFGSNDHIGKQGSSNKISARNEFLNSVRKTMEMDILKFKQGVEHQTEMYYFEIGKYNMFAEAVNETEEIQLGPSSRALLNYLFSKLLIFFAKQIKHSLEKKINIFNLEKFDEFCDSESYTSILNTINNDIEKWFKKFQLFYYGMDLEETVKSSSVKKIFTEDIKEKDYKTELKPQVQLVLNTTFKAAFNLGYNMKNQLKSQKVLRSTLIILTCQYIDDIFDSKQIKRNFPLYFEKHEFFTFLQFQILLCNMDKQQILQQIQTIIVNKQGIKYWNNLLQVKQKN